MEKEREKERERIYNHYKELRERRKTADHALGDQT